MLKNFCFSTSRLIIFCFIVSLALCSFSAPLYAQDNKEFAAERDKAIAAVNEGKYAEAIPMFEKLALSKEADGQVFFGLGIALYVTSQKMQPAQAKTQRARAYSAFLKAQQMGVKHQDLDVLLRTIKPDGSMQGESSNPEAQAAMKEAGDYFIKQDLEKALAAYEKAATLDPTLYEAALYTGNTYYAMKKYDKAGEWFAKAIAIDANRETAHRYWADALMNSGKTDEAREKFFDAIIAEPYIQNPWRGLAQWAQKNDIKLAHADIKIPSSVSAGKDGSINITLGMGDKDDDGSFAWTMYGLSRALWQTGKDKSGKEGLGERFKKQFPNETQYRHSLAEEIDGLTSVVTVMRESSKDKSSKTKQLDPSLVMLSKLYDAGLLEAWVLFARPDEGIIKDYAAYRQNNREKLRRYLTEYVLKNGGK